jgi:hypothetical protein
VCWLLKKIIGGLIVRLDSLKKLAVVYPFRCRQEQLSLKVENTKKSDIANLFYPVKKFK